MSELVKDAPPAFSDCNHEANEANRTASNSATRDAPKGFENQGTESLDEDSLCQRLSQLPLYQPPLPMQSPTRDANETAETIRPSDMFAPGLTDAEALQEENVRLKAFIKDLLSRQQFSPHAHDNTEVKSNKNKRQSILKLRDGTLARSIGEGATVLYHSELLLENKSAFAPEDEPMASPVEEAIKRDVIDTYTPSATAYYLSSRNPQAIREASGSNSGIGVMEVVDFEEHQFAEMLCQQGKSHSEIQAALRQRRRVHAELQRRIENPRIAKHMENQEVTWGESIVETGTTLASASAQAVTMTARAAVYGAHAGYTAISYASYLAARYPSVLPASQLAIARALCGAMVSAGIASTSPLLAYFVTKSPAGQYALQQLGLLVASISTGITNSKGEVVALAEDATKAAAGYISCKASQALAVEHKEEDDLQQRIQEMQATQRLKERIERNLPLRADERVVEVRDAVIVAPSTDVTSILPANTVENLPALERADVEELAAFVGVAEDDWWVLVSAARHAQLRADALERRRHAAMRRNLRKNERERSVDHEDSDGFEEIDELECIELKEGSLDPNGFISDPQQNMKIQERPVTLFERACRLLSPPLKYIFGSKEETKPTNITIIPMQVGRTVPAFKPAPVIKSQADAEPIELQAPRDRRLQPPPPSYAESLFTKDENGHTSHESGAGYWLKVRNANEREAQRRAVALLKGGPGAAKAQADLDLELDEEFESPNNQPEHDFVAVDAEDIQDYQSSQGLGYATTYSVENAVAEDRRERALALQQIEGDDIDSKSQSRAELQAVNALVDASISTCKSVVSSQTENSSETEIDQAELEDSGFVIVNDDEVRASIEELLKQSVQASRDMVFDPDVQPDAYLLQPKDKLSEDGKHQQEQQQEQTKEHKSEDKEDESYLICKSDQEQIQRGDSLVQEALQSFGKAKNVLMKHIQVGRWVCTVYYVGKIALKVFRKSTSVLSSSSSASLPTLSTLSNGIETVRVVLSCGLGVSYLLLRRALVTSPSKSPPNC